MGVKLAAPSEIKLQMQFRDMGKDVTKHVYYVDAKIQFVGQTIDIDVDWRNGPKVRRPNLMK